MQVQNIAKLCNRSKSITVYIKWTSARGRIVTIWSSPTGTDQHLTGYFLSTIKVWPEKYPQNWINTCVTQSQEELLHEAGIHGMAAVWKDTAQRYITWCKEHRSWTNPERILNSGYMVWSVIFYSSSYVWTSLCLEETKSCHHPTMAVGMGCHFARAIRSDDGYLWSYNGKGNMKTFYMSGPMS